MRASELVLSVVLAFGLVGCGVKSDKHKAPQTPLTVAEWKLLPVEQKYDPDTIERLKQGDPTLETPEGWEAFNRTTLLQSRKKDFPNGPKR